MNRAAQRQHSDPNRSVAQFRRVATAAALWLATTGASAQTADGPTFVSRAWSATTTEFSQVWNKGTPGLYLPFHTRHGRNSYAPEKIAALNETTWGLGYHRTLRDERGNYRGLYAMGLSDSHRDLQLQVGYSYEWAWPFWGPLEFRLGYTALMIRRVDMYGGVPFPGVLPLFGLGSRNLDLKMTYIPRISDNMGNGDVLFLMMSYTF
jgi:lipid IVA palmitoyltransferase